MDDSELSGQRQVNNWRTRPRGDPGGSFEVLVAYDSDIQQHELQIDRSNRSEATLRELAGLSNTNSATSDTSRLDYEEISVAQSTVGNIREIPVRDINGEIGTQSSNATLSSVPVPETQQQFDLFSSASLPPSPERLPSTGSSTLQHLNSSDPLVEGDRYSARYLRILVPQQDTSSQLLLPTDFHHTDPGYSRNTSHNYSEADLFESLPSTAENLLLESPTDSPAHFSQLRLTLNSIESDGETFVSLDDTTCEQQQSLGGNSFRQPSRQQSHQQKLTSRGKVSEKAHLFESGLEKELRRLVVEIYSEKQTEFVPIAGLQSSSHPAKSIMQQDLQSRNMGDSHPTFVHYQDSTSSVVALNSATSPDLPLTEMEDIDGAKPVISGVDQPQPAGASFNTLSSLSTTADALALQRSVIGTSPTKPASMEEIAAAIAAAEKQYRQRLQHYKQQQQEPTDQHSEQIPNGSPAFNMDKLDEMPIRLPATPPKHPSDTEENLSHTDPNAGHTTNSSQEAPAKTKSLPATTRVRPGSLVAQNTGLAVSSAVGTRFGTPFSNKDHGPVVVDSVNKERILFRSPVQAITTSRGGRAVTVHKPEHHRVDVKGSGSHPSKKIGNQVYASPADIKASIASQSGELQQDKQPNKLPQSFVAVTAAADQFHVQEIGLEPNSEVIVTRDPQSARQRHLSGEGNSTNADPEAVHQSVENAPVTNTEEEKPKHSFLGSFFHWGKKQDPEHQSQHQNSSQPPVSPPSSASPAAVALQNNLSSLEDNMKSPYADLRQQAAAESHDSGIDLVPTGSNVGEVFHAEFEPAHASTPVKHRHGSNDSSVRQQELIAPDAANSTGRLMNSHSNQVSDSDDETDSRIQATLSGPLRDVPYQQQPVITKDNSQRPSKPFITRANHVGNSTPVTSFRRKDFHKMPTTSLTSVYGSLKTSTPRFAETSMELDPADLESVLREKANLEGRLETLAAETESALQQRAEMQTQIASLQAQLKTHSSATDTAQQQVSAMTNDMVTAQHNQAQLEQALSALQNSLERKEEDVDSLQRELQASEASSHRLNAKMEEVREVMESKEATITVLKGKIAAVQKGAEKAHQEQTQHLAELKTLQGDVQSLTSAKEWFQEQLQMAQETRIKLQKELTETQTQAKKYGAAVETLKAEKAQLQHQLSETQQQALHEKELIAKHLETIEADFLAREAAFQDLQKEKTAVQEAVASRMDQMNEERSKLSDLIASCVELERQLDRTEKELADKQTEVSNHNAEKKELVKRLALVQESLLARNKELDALQEKCIDAESKVQELQSKAVEQEGSMQNNKAEKAALEAALATAIQEKRVFDEALQSLRQDMGKVEHGFKQMKQDLSQKDAQMESLQRDREDLQMHLRDAEQELSHHQRSMDSFQEDMSSKEDLVAELNKDKGALEVEVASLRQHLEAFKKYNLESHAVRAGLQDELAHSQDELKELEAQLESAMTENAHLEGQLEMMADEQQRFSKLLDDNAKLKQKLAETQSTTHRELADQRAKVLRLGSDLASTQKELKEKQRAYETTASALTRKLKEAMDAKQTAEADIESLRQNEVASNIEVQNRLAGQLEAIKENLVETQKEKDDLERQLEGLKQKLEDETAEYKERVAELENQLQTLKELCEQQQRNEAANRRMALDLERERGRLAGVQQSHSALKQHANLLEAALGRRETTLAEIAAQMMTNSQEHASEEERLRAKLRDQTQAHKKEKEASKALQKQVAAGRAQVGSLQQDIRDQAAVLEETRTLQDRQANELQTLQQELNRATKLHEEQNVKTEEVGGQLEDAKGQLGQLKRQLQEKYSRDPVVAEQIKALEWESEQRGREVEALKEQLELAEHRQKIEMDNAQATIQMGRRELEALKTELAATRKEKFAYQGKLSQFKSALKATLQQNKLLKAKLRSRQKEKNATPNPKMAAGLVASGDVTMVPDDIIVPEISVDVEALLSSDDKDGITATSSKPLTALRGCLQSVKDQMGGLQQQMDEHTSTVNSSSKAWKDVESKVRDLRKSCMTPIDGASTPPISTSRRSTPTTATPETSQAASIHNSPRTTPASMSFASLPNVYDI